MEELLGWEMYVGFEGAGEMVGGGVGLAGAEGEPWVGVGGVGRVRIG